MDFNCNHSPHDISSICLSFGCENDFLCQKCLPAHDSSHSVHIKPLQEFVEFVECDRNSKMNEILKLTSDSVAYNRKINEQFHQILDRIKDEFDNLILKFKDSLNERTRVRDIQNSLYIARLKGLSVKLQRQYAEDHNPTSDLARSVFSFYLGFFEELQKQDKLMIKKSKVLSDNSMANQIADMIKTIEESFSKFEAAYFDRFYIKENKEQNNADDNKKLSTNFDISLLTKEAVIKLPAPPSWNSFDYVGDQNLLVSGDQRGYIGVWNITDLKNPTLVEKCHEGPVNNVLYYKKGGYIVTASDDGMIKALEMPLLNTKAKLKEHKDKVWSLLIVEDNDTLYSSGKEACILAWDLKTLTLKHKIDTCGRDHTGTQMAFIPKLQLLAVSFEQGTIGLFDINTPSEVFTLKVHQKWLHSMIYIAKRDELLVGTDNGTIHAWRVGNHDFQLSQKYIVPGDLPTSIVTIGSSGNQVLVATGHDGLICLDLESGGFSTKSDLGINIMRTVKVIKGERRLISVSEENEVILYRY